MILYIFSRGLSLEDGATTLTEFTANIISSSLMILKKKKIDKNFSLWWRKKK